MFSVPTQLSEVGGGSAPLLTSWGLAGWAGQLQMAPEPCDVHQSAWAWKDRITQNL